MGALFLGIPVFLSARDTDPGERSPVGVEDYGKGERPGGATLSPDGAWIACGVDRVEEDEEPGIDPTGPLYFRLYDGWQEASGIARLEPGADEPERLLRMEKQVRGLQKAEDAEVCVWRQEEWGDSPDLFVGGPELADPAQVSRTSLYNTAIFTAEGYFVFRPDIVYRDRNPGLSAVEALEPAVCEVLATGSVDSTRIGPVGHSWGGDQTAFTATRTDIFAAAVAGAPLTNLVSMYNSVYWRTAPTTEPWSSTRA